ncbi:MAG: hypothetical protein OEV93_01075 [Candidatus Moranbacteria bacterium]|nr:hypothetical protein [Candidatus Moranbacteria bacterium]
MQFLSKQKSIISFLAFFLFCGGVSFAEALEFNVRIPENYTDIRAGEEVGFDVDIKYPENTIRKAIDFEYKIRKGDQVIVNVSDSKLIENSALFVKFITIPASADTGMYVLDVSIKDFDTVLKTDLDNFHITGNKEDKIKVYFLITFGIIVSLIFILIVVRDFLKKDDKKKEEK